MKKEEIIATIANLGPCFMGEYRGSLVERIDWVDKTDGKAKPFVVATHLFESGTGGAVQPIRIDQPIPKTVKDVSEVKVTLVRGRRYLMQLRSLKNDRGNMTGKLNPEFEPTEVN